MKKDHLSVDGVVTAGFADCDSSTSKKRARRHNVLKATKVAINEESHEEGRSDNWMVSPSLLEFLCTQTALWLARKVVL
jgi:hypothetical protein